MKTALFLSVALLALPICSFAKDTLTVGALASFGSSEYATDDKVSAVPLFLYDDDRFYVEGTEAGVYALKTNQHWVRAGLNYDARSFNPHDGKTAQLKSLDKRKSSINAQASYMYITSVGGFEIKASSDVLDKSGGQTLSLAHRSRFVMLDDKLTIYPKFGVLWHSDDYNNYYYGVSEREANRTGLRPYTAKSSVSPFVSVSARYKLSNKVGVFAHQGVEWSSSAQKNSPLTDDSLSTTTRVGLTYDFDF